MKKHKNKLVILLLSVVALSGSLAYFSAKTDVENIITTGSVDVEIIELDENDDVQTEMEHDRVMPGEEIVKKVRFKNTGNNPSWLRVKVESEFENDNLSDEVVSINFNSENWEEKDGYYYYTEQLEPDSDTSQLFDTIRFSTEMGNEYQNQSMTLKVTAEAVQSEFNGDSVFEVSSWQ